MAYPFSFPASTFKFARRRTADQACIVMLSIHFYQGVNGIKAITGVAYALVRHLAIAAVIPERKD